MYDGVKDGNLVVLETTESDPKPGQTVAVICEGGHALKRLLLSRGHSTLWADNLSILGTVTRIIDREVR
jgi:SOS-response transcriptional repressor LexA